MKKMVRILGLFLAVGVLGGDLLARTTSAGRYDNTIQAKAAQFLASKQQFQRVQASVEDGIVTLKGNVDLYQQKLDAAKKVKKLANVQGVRNLINVEGSQASDAELTAQLDRKLYYDRVGYDNLFNFVDATVENGVATVTGEVRIQASHDSALWLVANTPGVKDVVDNVQVLPTSIFDDRIRIAETRALYRDPVLSRYAIDPAHPIRIVVDNGHVTLYGTVARQMDKNVAGIKAGQVFGVFSVENKLEVEKTS